jgi:hypothetical protein
MGFFNVILNHYFSAAAAESCTKTQFTGKIKWDVPLRGISGGSNELP